MKLFFNVLPSEMLKNMVNSAQQFCGILQVGNDYGNIVNMSMARCGGYCLL